MRVGFDLRPALRKNSRHRGIGKYTRQLAQSLLDFNRAHDFVIYTSGGEAVGLTGSFETRHLPSLRKPSRLAWLPDAFVLPFCIARDRLDVCHATEITSIPRSRSCLIWAHVHDLIPFIYWREIVARIPVDYRYALQRALRRMARADLIITDSNYSRSDICQRLGMPEEKVQVVYLGCHEGFGPVDPQAARTQLRDRYRLEAPFLFYVGGSDFRKNIPRLVRVFARLRQNGYTGRLVLGGETFLWDVPEIREIRHEVSRHRLEGAVVYPGYIPDGGLPLFYSACDAFAFPSLCEGFGLPVLEAMKCGAPLAASRRSSIPEVAGDAAAYFDPEDEDDMLRAISAVCSDRGLAMGLRAAGFERAALFSWEQAARQLHQLYERYGVT